MAASDVLLSSSIKAVGRPFQGSLALCRHCDLMQHLPYLESGEKANCARCGLHLDAREENAKQRSILYALSAIFMLLMANLFPFVGLTAAGTTHFMSFADTSSVLLSEHHQWLAVLVWLFIQAIPTVCMLAIVYLKQDFFNVPAKAWVARVLYMLKPWSMVDIFLIGLMISFVKLLADAEISLGPSFWAFCFFCVLHLRAFQVIDRRALWAKIAPAPQISIPACAGKTGLEQGIKFCHVCTALVAIEEPKCARCHAKVALRQKKSLQYTIALLIAASILYVPANLLPIMITVSFGEVIESTIISGCILMWQEGSYMVSLIIFLASIVIPVAKIVVMFWLCYLTRCEVKQRQHYSNKIYRVVDWIGRWSMIDVLVIAIMAALVRFDLLMSVYPGVAAIIFASVVILTMLAALSFDPRLLWDPITKKKDMPLDAAR